MAKLRLLGGFELQDSGGGAVSIATLKGRALLAYLTCAKGRIASRGSLALLLWSDSDSRKSRQNLRQVLFKLSRILTRHDLPILRADAQTVSLRNEDIWVDAWELESLAKAESLSALGRVGALYRGEFLQGLALDAPVFGDWLADMRVRVQNRALNCLHLLLERQREAGDIRGAISTGLRALEVDSSQEQVHRTLMELYLAKGMRGAALNQYRTCRFVLRRDLDVVPDRTTEALYHKIRDCKAESLPSYRGSSRATRSGPAGVPPGSRAWAPLEPPIGRAAEAKALRDSFIEACSRGARLFTLRGEAGIGKTHLLDTFAKHLEKQGVSVCRVAARQAESRIPMGLWRQILDALPPSRDSTLPQETGGMREAALPYGVPRGHGDGTDSPLPPHVLGNRLFGDAREGLARAGTQGPLVVILEDIQWADADSLQGLGRAVQSLRRAPVLFVTAARLWPETNPVRIAAVHHDLERAGLVRHCDLGPLSFGDSMALVDTALAARGQSKPGARQRTRLWKSAEGNPEMLLAGLAPSTRTDALSLPRNLQRSARQIMDRMSPFEKTLVQFASLAQGPLGLPIFARAAGLDPRGVATVLAKLTAENLLREAGGGFEIARAWFRKAVRDALPEHRHRAMHAAIASAIRAVEVQDPAPYFDALAYHCRAAGETLAAAEYRLWALELSLARGVRRGASKALESLVAKLPMRPPDPRIDAVCWRAGFQRAAIAEAEADPASALRHLRALERRGPRDGDPRAAVALTYALSRARCAAGDGDEGLRYARRALHLSSGQGGAEALWLLAERIMFRCHLHAPAAPGVISDLKAKARLARSRKTWSVVGEIVTAQALMEGLGGQVAAMTQSFGAAHAAAAKLREPRSEAGVLQIEGMVRTWAGDAPRAIEVLSTALASASASGDLIRACVIRGLRGQANFAHGLLPEAKADLEQAIAAAGSLGPVPYLPLYFGWLAEVSGRSGRRDDALKHACRAWRLAQRQGQAWNRAPILRALARGLAHARRPDIAAAERAVREAIAVQRAVNVHIGLASSHVAYGEVLRAAGDMEGSQVWFRQARKLRGRMGIQAASIEAY